MTIEHIYKLFLNCSGISIDTRTIKKDNIYFSINGAHFDGNQYASKAIENGAAYVVVDNINFYKKDDKKYILALNALETLQKLAAYHRQQLNTTVIAIAGSNGKTTTKELINAVLSQQYKVYATPGNFNNHIGLPLTLLGMSDNIE